MPNTKISPNIFPSSPGMRRNDSFQLTDRWEDDYGSGGDRHNLDYWHARRAFLNSYHFKEDDYGFKDKMKRSITRFNEAASDAIVVLRRELLDKRFKEKVKKSIKEFNDVLISVALDFRRELAMRRLGIKAFKFRLALSSSLILVSFRCYAPWLKKKETIQSFY